MAPRLNGLRGVSLNHPVGHDTLLTAEPPLHSMIVTVPPPEPTVDPEETLTLSDALVATLEDLGVCHAFAIFGGGIAPFCQAVSKSRIRLMHFRHEAGAAFAAIEASLATGRPTVVIGTTGPGLTNLMTGMAAARAEGAKVLFLTGCSATSHRGRGAFQETGGYGNAMTSLYTPGALLHHGLVLEHPSELGPLASRLAEGVTRKGGFVASIGLPLSLQLAKVRVPSRSRVVVGRPQSLAPNWLERCVQLLSTERFVIWAGFGARHAAASIRELAKRTGAPVMCTPRAKGIVPETDPGFLGVTGLGGSTELESRLRDVAPQHILVLGSRLGEMASFWSNGLVPPKGFIHVDVESEVFGAAYPEVPTLGIQAEIGEFVLGLLANWPETSSPTVAPESVPCNGNGTRPTLAPRVDSESRVRPSYLMAMIQQEIVERYPFPILTEAGNSFTWGNRCLRFSEPNRYRVSTGFGSMGHAAAGVLGAAIASQGKAVAIVGDGAMLMQNELNTAATYGTLAVWIILNDGGYGMIAQGMQSIGWQPFETSFHRTDFVAIAQAMGAAGVSVRRESDVAEALRLAVAATGPFVVDVTIDPTEFAPAGRRNQSLAAGGAVRNLSN